MIVIFWFIVYLYCRIIAASEIQLNACQLIHVGIQLASIVAFINQNKHNIWSADFVFVFSNCYVVYGTPQYTNTDILYILK